MGQEKIERGEEGAVTLELAIVITVLILMLAAITQFGMYMAVRYDLDQATYAGARLAASLPLLTGNDSRVSTAVTSTFRFSGLMTNFRVGNSMPETPPAGIVIVNSDGEVCNRFVVVWAAGNYTILGFKPFFSGTSTVEISSNAVQRYGLQAFCY